MLGFGAGTGLISTQVAFHVNGLLAVDVSESMLEQLINKQSLGDKKI